MLNSGYKDESRWNKVRAECKSHNTYYKLKVCPRLFSEKFHFGVRLLRLMEMEEWCESSCI
ncbi:Hypothetical protein CINCED_3A021665 [Cinara cedri]|uniref:Uncharacterized protein n=1 Tax=Cinara cedri TaxID=506608 RepID=A0A5E4NFL9_9HEMI|nr:Hypothetical protein CINCED_3A021665 [Cinara cedri]